MRIAAEGLTRRPARVLTATAIAAAVGCSPWLLTATASRAAAPGASAAAPVLSERDRATHLLSRATYGVRPQDADEVLRLGIDGWIDRQLHPDRIDDGLLEARLERITGAAPGTGTSFAASAPPPPPAPPPAQLPSQPPERMADASPLDTRASPGEAPVQQMPVEERVQRMALRTQIVFTMSRWTPDYLAGIKLERATSSERQLEEVMTDFWFNHFNVFMGKDRIRLVIEDYERSAIRAHVFGRFEDMLVATAQHPAMLMYLDNFLSTAPVEPAPASAPRGAQARGSGLNENYARELLELHTLGIDGGYTQEDVIETARAFTGWSIQVNPEGPPAPAPPGGRVVTVSGQGATVVTVAEFHNQTIVFQFQPEHHDFGEKVVLGRTLPARRGMEDGLDILHMLAHHPSTARHLASKLVRHFVADDPPPALVAEIASVFQATGGDLRAVTRALFTAEAFYDAAHVGAKVKRPFEFIASALRITGAEIQQHGPVLQHLRALGQVPYAEPAPTGYPVTQEDWVSAGAMLARMGLALDLAEGRIGGIQLRPQDLLGDNLPLDPGDIRPIVRILLDRIVAGTPAADLEDAIVEGLVEAGSGDMRTVVTATLAVALGGPAFQMY